MSTFLKFKKAEQTHRREYLIECAARLFDKMTFSEVGMRQIAREANISPASIYRYFPSQEDLYVETLFFKLANIRWQVSKRSQDDRFLEKKIAEATLSFFLTNEAAFQIICHFMVKENIGKSAQERFKKLKKYLTQSFNQLVSYSKKSTNKELVSDTIIATLIGLLIVAKNRPDFTRKNAMQISAIPIQLIMKIAEIREPATVIHLKNRKKDSVETSRSSQFQTAPLPLNH